MAVHRSLIRPAIKPVVWKPPPAPPRARQRNGDRPLPPMQVLEICGTGPEDVVLDSEGRIVTGVADGRILRLSPDGRHQDVLTSTGGRPLGIELLPEDMLLVCDAFRGLLRVDPVLGDVEVLVDEVDGERLRFCNNAAVASDGTVYFTDSSRRFTVDNWKADVLEHSGTGRLLRYDANGRVEVLLDDMHFPNGVALAPDESYLVVAEMSAYRLLRIWLGGPRGGTHEVFVDNLPAFVDNISTGADGLFWLGLPVARNALLDRLHALPPLFRQAAWALPERLQPDAKPTAWVIAIDGDGRVVHDLQGPGERYQFVTSATERNGRVYLGSLEMRGVAVFELT
jgi:sugar lactone lactonase YvrE